MPYSLLLLILGSALAGAVIAWTLGAGSERRVDDGSSLHDLQDAWARDARRGSVRFIAGIVALAVLGAFILAYLEAWTR